MRHVLPLLPALLALWSVGCRMPGEGPPRADGRDVPADVRVPASRAPADAGPDDSAQASRRETQRGLEAAYAGLASVLDSLARDSLAARGEMGEQYRRILRDARTAKDNTKVHLDGLRVGASSVTPEIWEAMRARADLSLDTLRRLLISADSAHKLDSP